MIKTLQALQERWSDYNFGPQPPSKCFYGLVEELGELAHSSLKASQGIRVNEDHEAKEKDAIGDIFIYLMGYCNSRNFDLAEIVEDTCREVFARDWIKYPEDGLTK